MLLEVLQTNTNTNKFYGGLNESNSLSYSRLCDKLKFHKNITITWNIAIPKL